MKGGQYTTVFFKSENGGEDHLWFRIESKQYTKLTAQADLESIASEITHFVQRDVISAEEMQERTWWTRVCGTLPFVSSQVTRDTRRVELIVEATPTADELQEMLDTYHERYGQGGQNWSNIGFRKEGAGGTCWLDEFVVKSVLFVSDLSSNVDDSGHYTTERLFNALHLTRDRLLAPFTGRAAHIQSSNDSNEETEELIDTSLVAEV